MSTARWKKMLASKAVILTVLITVGLWFGLNWLRVRDDEDQRMANEDDGQLIIATPSASPVSSAEELRHRYKLSMITCLCSPNSFGLRPENFAPGLSVDCGDEEVRYSGDHAQLLRLLAWIACSDYQIRKKWLLAWLAEKDGIDRAKLRDDLMKAIISLSPDEQEKRRAEILETLSLYEKEREIWNNYRILDANGARVGVDTPTGIQGLDYLVEHGKTDRPLGNSLFYMSAGERRKLYEGIQFPPVVADRNWPSEWSSLFRLHMLLWRFEPDATVRREVLVTPRLMACFDNWPPHHLTSYYLPRDAANKLNVMLPESTYWEEFSESDRDVRQAELKQVIERTVEEGIKECKANDMSAKVKEIRKKYGIQGQ